ncbi:ROK family protein [Streptomyces sp. NBC_00988]|uniref:ROK family transcriptional regulator n=1 Tax=Streptomyces sp. NBC_00988 TaxID=2903704 RepID=UPI0038699EA8|nr:ROK family protein [Streptomyces sp. NBC_00988]
MPASSVGNGLETGLVLPLVSPSDAGRVNRARLLRLLYAHGPLSRSELARLLGAQRAVVGTVAQPLIDGGMLEEREARPSGPSGGKGGRPLWFAEDSAPIGAVHLMPASVRAAVVGVDGTVLASAEAPLDPRAGTESVLETAERALRSVMGMANRPLRGVGIAVGGMVNTSTGEIVHVELAPELDGLAIAPEMRRRLGLPVLLDLHPRAQALGDLWFGEGRGLSSFVSLYCGDAIGMGYVTDGVVQRGNLGAGGEIGHTVLNVGGDLCRCGKRGCWDTMATATWLRRRAGELGLPGAERLSGSALTGLVAAGTEGADVLLQEYAEHLALGVALVYQLLAPGAVLLHGDPAEAGEPLRRAVESALSPLVMRHPGVNPSVILAPLDDAATLRGAACLVLADMMRFSV